MRQRRCRPRGWAGTRQGRAPAAQRIRALLRRTNLVLGAGVLLVWATALWGGDEPAARRRPPEIAPTAERDVRLLEPDVAWDDLVALCRAFHGWEEEGASPKRAAAPPVDGRLPLAAFGLRALIHDRAGPDLAVLRSKDPAHPVLLLPMEGAPDRGVAIERIARRGGSVFVSVRRGEERFTYRMDGAGGAAGLRADRVRVHPASEKAAAPSHRSGGRIDVKLLPYFGRDGAVEGARVTGVRPGSRLEAAGLRAGDLILGIDRAGWPGMDACRARLGVSGQADIVHVRRRGAGPTEAINLDS